MKIIIHRGSHQIGGIAVEIKTDSTRIIIDMGDELTMDNSYQPKPLNISGVTDKNGKCSAVFFTHYHGDHTWQLPNIRKDIPIFMGELTKDILLATMQNTEQETINRIKSAEIFEAGQKIPIGDITVTPYSIDHSACDSYMFLIEAEGKKILHTGDFRTHGFRGKAVPKILRSLIKKVDVLITEGTNISRANKEIITECQLQHKVKKYMKEYKYVFAYTSTTNLERICGFAKAVPQGKYFICDEYQNKLLNIIEEHWKKYYKLCDNIKKITYGINLLPKFKERGFLMMVRDNSMFRKIILEFDKDKSIMLYSMWDGYRTHPESTIPEFLALAGKWEYLHTSGHAYVEDIKEMVKIINPSYIIPIHTDIPEIMRNLFPDKNIIISTDGEEIEIT